MMMRHMQISRCVHIRWLTATPETVMFGPFDSSHGMLPLWGRSLDLIRGRVNRSFFSRVLC